MTDPVAAAGQAPPASTLAAASLVVAVAVAVFAACSAIPVTSPGALPSTTSEPAARSSAVATPTSSPPSVPFSGVCQSTGDFKAGAVIEGSARSVIVHRPASAASRAPLVIALHGLGASPAAMVAETGLSSTADEHGFVAVYPAGEDGEWGVQLADPRFRRDGELLANLVDTLVADGCVDPDRVVLAGFSLGGILAHTIACTDAGRFHIVVAVAARDLSERCAPTRAVTFVAYNGLLDHVIPYEGGIRLGFRLSSAEAWMAAWAARNGCSGGPATALANDRVVRLEWTTGCGAPVVLYRIRLGHHVWPGPDAPLGGLAVEDLDPTEMIVRLLAGEEP